MKRWSCLCLVVLLLCGCAANTDTEEAGLRTPFVAAKTTAERRDVAESHMRYMMSVLWQPEKDICYSTDVRSLGTDMDAEDKCINLYAGRVYAGMPYTHGSGGAEGFLSFGQPDENGVLQMKGVTAAHLSGGGDSKHNNQARLSNDCADAVYWAWSRVASSISFTMTQNMTASRGCLPVGDYKTEDGTYTKTRTIAVENGEQTMFAAYACLQKADAVVTYNGSGHAMLVSQVHVVEIGGVIDPEQSYVLVHEQFTGNTRNEVSYVDEETGLLVYQLGGVDRQYTFAKLFKSGYLPITIKELNDPAAPENMELVDSLEEYDHTSLAAGTLSTMAKIVSVTVTVTDKRGTVVQQATCFPRESQRVMFRMDCFVDALEQQVSRGRLEPEALQPGEYRCLTQCVVGTGQTVTARDYTFTVQ